MKYIKPELFNYNHKSIYVRHANLKYLIDHLTELQEQAVVFSGLEDCHTHLDLEILKYSTILLTTAIQIEQIEESQLKLGI